MKPIQMLMIMVCANTSIGLKLDDDDDDLPVISVKAVSDSIVHMLNSPSESLKEVAKETFQCLKSQMDDKSKQYAKLTLNGIRFAVNMGSSESALRSENEAMLSKLWSLIVSLFYNILSWFDFGDQQIDKLKPYTVVLSETDDYYIEDAIFMKIALQQQLCEIEDILYNEQAISKYIKDNSIPISETVWARIKQDNLFELKYRNELKQSIDLLDEAIRLVDKEAEEDKKK